MYYENRDFVSLYTDRSFMIKKKKKKDELENV